MKSSKKKCECSCHLLESSRDELPSGAPVPLDIQDICPIDVAESQPQPVDIGFVARSAS